MPPARPNGNDGCDSTGARIAGSSIIDSAKLPVKHMPIAPTPLPPHCCVRVRRERPQPRGDRTRTIGRKRAEFLLMHARAIVIRELIERRQLAPIVPKRLRHPHRESGIANEAGEARDVVIDARHFRHHDHGGTLPGHVDGLRAAQQRDLPALEIAERFGCEQRQQIGFAHGIVSK